MRYPGEFHPKPRIRKISAPGAALPARWAPIRPAVRALSGGSDRLVVVFVALGAGVDVPHLMLLAGVGLGPDLVDLLLQVLELLAVLLDLALVVGHASSL